MAKLVGRSGADVLNGGSSDDVLSGGAGNDILIGGDGADRLDGDFGDDTLYGGSGKDVLIDRLGGNDGLYGEEGDDRLRIVDLAEDEGVATPRSLVLDGGAGSDSIRLDAPHNPYVTASLIGGEGNDLIAVDGGGTVDIDAGSGDDVIKINADRYEYRSEATYTVRLGTGSDTVSLLSSTDLDWSNGLVDNDSEFGGSFFHAIAIVDFQAGVGGDRLDLLGFLKEHVAGLNGSWNLATNPFATGQLRLLQSGEHSLLQLLVDEFDPSVREYVSVFKTIITFENVVVNNLTAFNLSGFDPNGLAVLGQAITGATGADTLVGLSGDDVLSGGDGKDVLSGGAGNDTVRGGDGDDRLDGDVGDDQLFGGAGNDILTDRLGGNDSLYGEDGDDRLHVIDFTEDEFNATPRTLVLDGGAGNDSIRLDARYNPNVVATIVGAEGNDQIAVDGGGQITIDTGAGDDVVKINADANQYLPQASYSIRLGAGRDTLSLLSSTDIAWSNGLIDTESEFGGTVFQSIRVSDFTPGTDGDRLDLLGFLKDHVTGWNGDWDPATDPFATGYLRLVQVGGDTVLQVLVEEYDFQIRERVGVFKTLITFENVDKDDLTAFNLSGFDPAGVPVAGQDITGTGGNDVLVGLSGADVLNGGGGDDVLSGGVGNDILIGGDGNDRLDGDFGDDMLYGGLGNDVLLDRLGGNDSLFGEEGDDQLRVIDFTEDEILAIPRSLLLDGGAGNDNIRLDAPQNPYVIASLIGGDGNDLLTVDGGGQVGIDAGAGDDVVKINVDRYEYRSQATYTVRLGSGSDTVSLLSSSDLDWSDGRVDTESEFGSAFFHAINITDFEAGAGGDRLDFLGFLKDHITGWNGSWDPASNPFETGWLRLAQRGADVVLQIKVQDYDPQLDGYVATFRDVLVLENVSIDALVPENINGYEFRVDGRTSYLGTDGPDSISPSATVEISGEGGDDVLTGGAGNDILRGGAGNDKLYGGAGHDLLSEFSGDYGPFGDDLYDGGAGNDRVSYFLNGGPGVAVDLRITGPQNTVTQGVDTLISIEHVTATYGDDTLIGNEAGNWFWTFSGTDRLFGNGGNDTFTVGLGDKIIDGGSGTDTVDILDLAFAPRYTSAGVTVSLLAQGSAQAMGIGNWTLTSIENLGGWYGNDRLTGDAKANVLAGGQGDDVLIGGGGDDVLVGDGAFGLNSEQAITLRVDPDWVGGADQLDGGDGNDVLTGNGGRDILTGGTGKDSFVDTFAGLNGDTITDFTVEDRIVIKDASLGGFQFSLSGSTLTLAGATLTLSGLAAGTMLFARAAAEGGVELTINTSGQQFSSPGRLGVNDFLNTSGWSSQSHYPRHIADVNGDGVNDIVGFGQAGVLVSFGAASGGFSTAAQMLADFGQASGWSSDNQFHRELADVNGDGRADIIGFGVAGTLVSLARADGSFAVPVMGIGNFGANQGWSTQDAFARVTGDVNGDGKADIIGFGVAGTLVSLGKGDGTFATAALTLADFGVQQGWSSDNGFHRTVADVNGDGFDDIIGFGKAGTLVALSKGDGSFDAPLLAIGNFGADQGWASQDTVARAVADLNGDGHADIVGFGVAGTYVAYGLDNGTFMPTRFDVANFGANQGWSSDNSYHRDLADINADGTLDIVGFGAAGVFAGYNQGHWMI